MAFSASFFLVGQPLKDDAKKLNAHQKAVEIIKAWDAHLPGEKKFKFIFMGVPITPAIPLSMSSPYMWTHFSSFFLSPKDPDDLNLYVREAKEVSSEILKHNKT